MAEDLILGQPRTNPASGQSGTQTQEHLIAGPTHWPLRHSACANTHSPDWAPYISSKNWLREFVCRSKPFPSGDHFINSHSTFSWLCIYTVGRKLTLVTLGTKEAWDFLPLLWAWPPITFVGNEGVIEPNEFPSCSLAPTPSLPLIVMAFTQQLEIISDCPDTQITLAFLIPVNSCNQKVRTELDFQSN